MVELLVSNQRARVRFSYGAFLSKKNVLIPILPALNMKKINFSIKSSRLDSKEMEESMKMAEEYFKSSSDPDQASITMENAI